MVSFEDYSYGRKSAIKLKPAGTAPGGKSASAGNATSTVGSMAIH
jgi:hypothetical protein